MRIASVRVAKLGILSAALGLAGCNAGVGLILGLVLSDDGGGGKKKKSELNVTTAELVGVENARLHPEGAVILLRLHNAAQRRAEVLIELSEAGESFHPATVFATLPARSEEPGRLEGLTTSSAGVLHRIPWNARQDVGDDALHALQLRISGTLDRDLIADVLVGNDAPAIAEASAAQAEGEPVLVDLVLKDSSSDPVDLRVEFALIPPPDGAPAFVPAALSVPAHGLAASPEGLRQSVIWEAVQDAGPFDRPAVLRLVPSDRIDGQTGKIGAAVEIALALDNNRKPEVELHGDAFLIDPDRRGGVVLRFLVRDKEENPVDAIIQWAAADDPFPELDASLDVDPARRRSLLESADERGRLHIATLRSEVIEGAVEAPAASLAPGRVLAAWIKSEAELRGLPAGAVAGRIVSIGPPSEPPVRACAYDPGSAILELDTALDPAPSPGARLRIDLGGAGGASRLSASADGVEHRAIWDASGDLPGGGLVRLRVTPFDDVKVEGGCSVTPGSDAEDIVRGARGVEDELNGSKRLHGPFRADDAWVAPLAPVDSPAALAAADFDGDGRMDLACAARSSDAVVLLLQTLPGVFEQIRLADNRLRSPSGLVARDLDGDGSADLAVSGEDSGIVLVIFQKRPLDFFSSRVALRGGGALVRPTALTSGDFDGDGDVDLAVAEAGGPDKGVRVFLRNADAQDACGPEEGGYRPCLLRDPNQEEARAITPAARAGGKRLDIVTGGAGFIAVYSLPSAESPGEYMRHDVPGADLRSLAVADLDGDGTEDLIVADGGGSGVRIGKRQAAQTFVFTEVAKAEGLHGPVSIVEGDLDRNGVADFAVADAGDPATGLGGGVHVFLGGSTAGYSTDVLERPPVAGRTLSRPRAVVLADFDGDGSGDIASAEDGTHDAVIYRQGSPGSFREPSAVIAGEQETPEPASLAAGDIDGDGRIDLVAASREADEVTYYHASPGGEMAAFALTLRAAGGAAPPKRGPVAAAVGDLNGDGLGDIAAADLDSSDLTILIQTEGGRFATQVLRADGFSGPQAVALGDVDGDGRLDLAAAARFTDEARWFRQTADGSFAEAGAFRAGPGAAVLGPLVLALGDVDGDAKPDLVTANHRSGNVAVFLQAEPRGTFDAPVGIGLGAGVRPLGVVIRDLDGDGRADIATADLGRAAASRLLQRADGSFDLANVSPLGGAQATSIAAADLDGDGKLDLMVGFAGTVASFVQVFRQGDGAGFDWPRSLHLASPEAIVPIAVVAVDADGDGKPDAISANRVSRNVTAFWAER